MGGTFDNRALFVSSWLVRGSSGLLERCGGVGGVRFVHIIGSWRPRPVMLFCGCGWAWFLTLRCKTCCLWWGDRPYVENYTVDASIFETQCVSFIRSERVGCPFGVVCVFILFTYVISSFKEQTVDALASGAEEGRSNLR